MQLKFNKLILILFFFLVISPNENLKAQNDPILVDSLELKPSFGAFIGYNLNFHNADFRSLPGVPSCCPKYTGGFGTGLYFGGLLDYPINYLMQITGRISYSQHNGELKRFEQTTVLLDGVEAVGEF